MKRPRSESGAAAVAVILATVLGVGIGYAVALEMGEARHADGAGEISPEEAWRRIVTRWRARKAEPTVEKTLSPLVERATEPVQPIQTKAKEENGSTSNRPSRTIPK